MLQLHVWLDCCSGHCFLIFYSPMPCLWKIKPPDHLKMSTKRDFFVFCSTLWFLFHTRTKEKPPWSLREMSYKWSKLQIMFVVVPSCCLARRGEDKQEVKWDRKPWLGVGNSMRGYVQHLVLTSFSTESLWTRCPAGTTVKLDCGKHRHAGTDKGEKNRRSFYF